jgi:hypothetical protein
LGTAEIVAIEESSIVRIDGSTGQRLGKPCRIGKGDVPELLVAAKEGAGVGVVTASGKVLQLDAASCRTKLVAHLPNDSGEANALKGQLRAVSTHCEASETFSSLQEVAALDSHKQREDVFVRTGEGVSRNLTERSPRTVNVGPAFSGDCKSLVYLACE